MERTVIDHRYVKEILQMYKTALIKEVDRNIHLFWEDGKINWSAAEGTHPFYRNCKEDELFKQLSQVNHVIEPVEEQMAALTVQYAGGMVVKVVEEWLSWLEPKEAEVLFYTYINHDYKKKFGWFVGLSETEIAKKMNISTYTVWAKKKDGIKKILDKIG